MNMSKGDVFFFGEKGPIHLYCGEVGNDVHKFYCLDAVRTFTLEDRESIESILEHMADRIHTEAEQ